MHVAALAAAEARDLAEHLGGHLVERHALGDREVVRAVGADLSPVASGLFMLLHQGVEQVRLFTARPRAAAGMPEPDWAAVTRAAADALGPAAG